MMDVKDKRSYIAAHCAGMTSCAECPLNKYLEYACFEDFVTDEVVSFNYDILTEKTPDDSLKIKVKYHTDIIPLTQITNGDWIDLRAAETVEMKQGESRMISLGISMELPAGYEANVVPRSSTFKNFGIILLNSVGVIDNSYCGNDDVWKFNAYALRDTVIHKNDRICQFRITKNMPKVKLEEVEQLTGKNRGGFGTTGTV